MNLEKQKWLFPKTLLEAEEAQKEMAKNVIHRDFIQNPLWIAGMDVSNNPLDPEQKVFAAVVLLSYPQLSVIEVVQIEEKERFPYVPGFLGFREAPPLIHAFEKLKQKPDLILVDGHGISHPRKLGIASQIGVLLDLPTIGVAKSILVGSPKKILDEEKGSKVDLVWKKERIGIALRTKKRCLPLILSVGHKTTLETAAEFVLTCIKGYRLPEPTRQAHLAANLFRLSSLRETEHIQN